MMCNRIHKHYQTIAREDPSSLGYEIILYSSFNLYDGDHCPEKNNSDSLPVVGELNHSDFEVGSDLLTRTTLTQGMQYG
jgi:hypothetical protein